MICSQEVQFVEYHGHYWNVLVENGWTTWSVDGNTAKMVKVRYGR